MIKNTFKISFIYIATLLGAGFASGKELVGFFAKFSNLAEISFLFASFLIGLSASAILYLIKTADIDTYSEFLKQNFGKFLSKFVEILNTIFLFILFSAMMAAGASIFSEILKLEYLSCLLIFSLIIFISTFFGKNYIVNINYILCPVIIIGGILVGIYLKFFSTEEVFSIQENFLGSAVLYTSYNIITTISVLFGIRNLILNKKTAIFSGAVSALLFFAIGIFTISSLSSQYYNIKDIDFPVLNLIGDNFFIKITYTLVILMAIYTTAICNLFALENTFKERFKFNSVFLKLLIIFLGILSSLIGFSNIVEKIYPIFGYLGLFQLFLIILLFFIKVFHRFISLR